MAAETLTPERILEATEEVLRRYGPAKATVVDVARALGVSHGSVYRHFRTKTALREAVTERWLERTSERLRDIVAQDGPADARLERWLSALFAAKRHKAGDDPELFATYMTLIGESGGVVERHIADLTGQLTAIIEDGIRQGVFAAAPSAVPATASPTASSTAVTARAVFDATGRFHDPCYAKEWSAPDIDRAFAAVCGLVLRSLRA
ncbi:TetR/AcrR family transcriptional regulator [Streptomyces sp. MST-110588]|uniref:TetR/AcrR family transcriptional regulator n=1 Tax=Streptomyces sp. MST-110588 TaxID=2833628 RepID=UPI001F5DC272|nr:TetR/AcrR family transcriptional regulator [Streptomyces sp. MST-110588]UNO42085.1 TetR/AcrR family transcriptional regulator [Streptomyces sp. MST-110588]